MQDDLAPLFGQEPGGPAQPLFYRQGRIVFWDPITLENQVLVGGTVHTNVPLLGVAEADSYSEDDAVGLMVIGRGLAIIGRMVIPASAAADEATALLSRRTAYGFVADQESTSSTSYVDLSTGGPSVTVNVRNTGRLAISLGAQMQRATGAAWGGIMSAEMSGANVMSATTFDDTLQVRFWQSITGGNTFTAEHFPYASAVFEGLNPGETTITAKYASLQSAVTVDIGRRSLSVTVL